MENVEEVRTAVRNMALPLMAVDPVTKVQGDQLMEKAGGMSATPPVHSLGPQRAKEGGNAPIQSEFYLRLEIHFEDGRLSVIGAKSVPGPLTHPTAVIQGYIYEVLIGDQQIAVGSLPDVGVRRAFANRDVPGPEGKHRFIQVPDFDFFVRVARAHVTAEDLPKMDIILHSVRVAPDRLIPALGMQKQPAVEATEIARLSGIILESTPLVVRTQLEGIITENKIAH
jgi:hypothetical protein